MGYRTMIGINRALSELVALEDMEMRKSKSLIWLIVLLILLIILLLLWWFFQQGGSPTAQNGKTVFVTQNTFSGNLDGLDGADENCTEAAAGAGLSGTYRAWISGRTQSNQDAAGRLSHATEPYKLVNGATVANDWSNLISGTLLNAINITESGNTISDGARVWTNTRTNGQAWDILRDCALGSGPATWTCNPTTECPFESGKYGLANATDGSWTGQESSNTDCAKSYRLYCFEQ